MTELRKNTRFSDFGRVECEKISAMPGILCDISLTGIKVAFATIIDFNMDDEFELSVMLSKLNGESLKLLVIPIWKFDNNINESADTQIGFSILHALDYDKLCDYIDKMEDSDIMIDNDFKNVTEEFQIDNKQEDETPCQFL